MQYYGLLQWDIPSVTSGFHLSSGSIAHGKLRGEGNAYKSCPFPPQSCSTLCRSSHDRKKNICQSVLRASFPTVCTPVKTAGSHFVRGPCTDPVSDLGAGPACFACLYQRAMSACILYRVSCKREPERPEYKTLAKPFEKKIMTDNKKQRNYSRIIYLFITSSTSIRGPVLSCPVLTTYLPTYMPTYPTYNTNILLGICAKTILIDCLID
ncbi:hypothetical protein VTN02DRAFT_1904 [Thermoascus thermophilus]